MMGIEFQSINFPQHSQVKSLLLITDKLKHPRLKLINLLKPNDIYIVYISYRSANLQMLHFKYLFNKHTYWIF